MNNPDAPLPWTHPIRVAELAGRKPTRFTISPEGPTLVTIAAWANVTSVSKLVLKGMLTPKGRTDWLLEATLDAQVAQPCVVSLVPVRTTLREEVRRSYLADLPDPEGDEVEIPEDDTVERLPAVIDLGAVALEALELALPLYPRADGAEFDTTRVTTPGHEPLTDEDLRPFAGLRGLMDRLPAANDTAGAPKREGDDE